MQEKEVLKNILHIPSLLRLAKLIRREMNLWVGCIYPDGQLSWIGTEQPIDKPLCDAFMIHSTSTSCIETYHEWMKEVMQCRPMPIFMQCHAGMQGIFVPVLYNDEILGAYFASGFVFAEDNEADTTISACADKFGLSSHTVSHGCRELVRITQRESRLIREILVEMSAETVDFLMKTEQAASSKGVVHAEQQPRHSFLNIVGHSESMRRTLVIADQACESICPLLISGEAGSGKSLIARAIHYNSPRHQSPFIAQSCAGIDASQLESELFGHRRGATANAFADKPGLFDVADHGSFYLDDIEELPEHVQIKLLQFIKTGTFMPVGEIRSHESDVRLIVSSNCDLAERVEQGLFRRDLFDALNVVEIHVPRLAERQNDIPELCAHFLKIKCAVNRRARKSLSPDTLRLLMQYDWPGNVRELENEIERLVVLSGDNTEITPKYLAARISQVPDDDVEALDRRAADSIASAPLPRLIDPGQSLPEAMAELEKQIIRAALEENGGNRTKTAEKLQISRRNLIRKIDQYCLS